MKLNKTETAAFAEIGEALCQAEGCRTSKKRNLPLVAGVLKENHDEFIAGVTIGDYRFKLVIREELTAIRV